MTTSYHVCADCAHVELRPEDRFRCENCGGGAAWLYDTLEEAELESQSILDYKRATFTPERLRQLGAEFVRVSHDA